MIKRIRVQERQDQKYITRVVVYLSKGGLEYNIDGRGPHVLLSVIQPRLQASTHSEGTGTMKAGRDTSRIFFQPGPSPLTQILGLDFNVFEGGRSRLTVTTDKKARYSAKMTGPRTLLINIYNATAPPLLLRRLDAKYFKGAVERVKASSSTKNRTVSVTILMREKVPYYLTQTKGRLEVELGPSEIRPARAVLKPKHQSRTGRRAGGDPHKKETSSRSGRYIGALGDYAGQKMSFDFVDTDIRNVLKLIAEAMGINIVWGKEVTGTISLKLDNVPWDQALEMILKPSDLTYQIEGNVMWVVPRSKLIDMEMREKERRKALLAQKRIEDVYQAKVIEFVKVRYRKVETVFKLMAQVMDVSGAKIEVEEKGEEEAKKAKLLERDVFATFDSATNIIIIHGIRSKVEKIKGLITQLDVPEYQVMIEARIVDATTNFARDLGIQWNSLLGQAQSRSDVGFGTDPTLYPGPKRTHHAGTFTSNSPADWVANIGLFLGRMGVGQLTALTLDASLALAEEEGKTKIISAPKVIASSGQKAVISRGDVLIIPATEQVAAQEIEATLSLTVTPTISSKDAISLDVTVTDDRAASITQIIEKKVQTNFMVKSGETVVIGGIYREDDLEATDAIPVLGKIPLLGWLFKAEHKTRDKSELLIFLTATIVPMHRLPQTSRAAQSQ
ncbi:MAG: type IV pilus secretin PilQ [Deltaproteobacteria bacterium]|nr:type IV pilus secretin PilQ [Deltaproteobacteria bacterium]